MPDPRSIEDRSDSTAADHEAAEAQRRQFLKKLGAGIFASLVGPAVAEGALAALAEEAKASPAFAALPAQSEDEDVVLRMMRDLERALAKPAAQRKWSMVIDLRKCVGCHACTVSCVAENKLPPGVVYRPVLEEEIGTYPNVTRRFTPRPCMQCEEPPCTPVCPVHATWMREDGIVEIDYDQCIGCRYCITACPYSARTFDAGHFYNDAAVENAPALVSAERARAYEEVEAHDYGKVWERKPHESPIGNVRKCHFCSHRLDKGLLPECVTGCVGHATFFGDRNDPESLVSELIASVHVMRLKEEMGTNPKVYYLI